ncbi:MAG: LapA family protein [Spirochaetales bacterium]|nr:LapA family protein [Spirochaetales bacterium]
MKYVYLVSLVAIAILVAIFASQNTEQVTVRFFALSTGGSLSLFLVVSMSAGLVLGMLVMLPAVIGGRFRHFLTKGKLRRLESKRGRAVKRSGEADATRGSGGAEGTGSGTADPVEPDPAASK